MPSHLVGRLIGRGGAIVQELEQATGCRVRTSALVAETEQQDGERLTEVVISCTGARCERDREAAEARCCRAAQLLGLDGLSLADAVSQADAERDALERLEAARSRDLQLQSATRRIRIEWPEFAEEDVLAALAEAGNLDEDRAVDLLLQGFRAPVAELQQPVREREKSIEREAFPALPSAAPQSDTAHKSCGRWARATRRPQARPSVSTLKSTEEFPNLPVAAPLQVALAPRPRCGSRYVAVTMRLPRRRI